MKKKKLVLLSSAALLSLALAGSIGTVLVASADTTINGESETSAQTTVTYSVADSWSVTIPESIEIGGTAEIGASGVVIEQGKVLQVKVSSANTWQVKNTEGDQGFAYTLKTNNGSGTTLTNDAVALEVEAGTASGSETLKADLSAENTQYSTGGDSYTDTLTFSVSVVEDAG